MSEPGLPPLGFGQIWLSPKGTVNLVRIIVDPSLRGKGLGRQLSALLLSEARKLPEASVIWLRVLRSNTVALSVYKSLGFRIVESESNSGVYALAAG